jgi:hypothetical protein
MLIKTHSLSFDDLNLFIGQEQLKKELYQYQYKVDEIVYSDKYGTRLNINRQVLHRTVSI